MRLLIAIAFVCCTGSAYSQLPSPSGVQGTQQQNAKSTQPAQDAASEQRGTERRPLFIKSLPSPDSEAEARHKEYEHHEKPMLERFMGWGTLALSIFTFILFVFTGLLWWVTLQLSKDAKRSGEAQSGKMEASIREASRAATAMENLAVSAANNATITHEMYKKQMRAYIAVETGGGVYQDE